MTTNELIEQIGGRERLEELASFKPSGSNSVNSASREEWMAMASALLAVMDAKPIGTVSIAPDLYSIPRRNIATVNMRPGLVLSEMRDGDNLYTIPPATSVNYPAIPEGWIPMPKKLTAENGAKEALSGDFTEHKFINCPECFGDDECESCDGSGRIKVEVTVSWSTIKAIWEKGADHFATAPAPGGDAE